MEGLSKKEKGLMDIRVVITGGGGIRGIHGNGETQLKINIKNK